MYLSVIKMTSRLCFLFGLVCLFDQAFGHGKILLIQLSIFSQKIYKWESFSFLCLYQAFLTFAQKLKVKKKLKLKLKKLKTQEFFAHNSKFRQIV